MRFSYLDVLKAIAIISVVLYHSGFMSFGYLGVDLFLIINGYLITRSLSKKLICNDGIIKYSSYFNFEVSRLVRLLPVLLVAEVLCMAVGYWTMLPDDYENLSASVVATNFFGNNILSAITTKNYWDVVNEYKPLMHTWYLGIVMQFYLVYPLLFFLAKLDKKYPQRALLVMISILSVTSLLIYFGTNDLAHRFYYLPSRFFEFSVGGIIALTWKTQEREVPFQNWFVYACYAFLLVLLVVDKEFIAANIRLVTVVALSVVLIMSNTTLENKITANKVLAKIGAASYSIFVWHQIVLAFYRYSFSSNFSVRSYALILIIVAFLSWVSYRYIEQKTSERLKNKKSKVFFYSLLFILLLVLTGFAGYIFKKGGVVRDVPELYINKSEHVNHKEYNDKIYKLDKPFETNKLHWLVVGNSFGRDFANVILESQIADSIEVSYIYIGKYMKPEYGDRFKTADRVFLSSLGADEITVKEMEFVCKSNGFNIDNLVIVGTKNFGTSNGQFYFNRNNHDYFEQRTVLETGYYEQNERLKALYQNRYLDLISLVIDENCTMPVFTPDHHFISQDCRHFSKGGARWFSTLIDWEQYLKTDKTGN